MVAGALCQADTRDTQDIFTSVTKRERRPQVQVESVAQFSSVLGPDLPAKLCSVRMRIMGLCWHELIVNRCV